MRKFAILALTALLAIPILALVPSATAVTSSWPPPIGLCFGDHGVEFGTTHAALCLHKIAGGPSGGLYFSPSVDDGLNGTNPGGQMIWDKLHAAPGNYYVWGNYSQPWGGSAPRSNGRIVAIDEGPAGQCIVVFPSWSQTPTQCFLVRDGGAAVDPPHTMDARESASLAEYMKNKRAAIPLEYR